MKNILTIIKKHEFLSVIALCLVVICIISIIFGMLGIISAVEKSKKINLKAIDGMSDAEVAEAVEGCPTNFDDNRFLLAVSIAIDCPVDKLTEEKISNVKTIKITKVKTLENIDDIALFENLKSLTIFNCGVKSIEVLSNMDNLEFVNLAGNKIQDISPLSEIESLKELNISRNGLRSIENLKSDTLEILTAKYNFIKTVNSLKNLPNLNTADFSQNNITKIIDLQDAKHLKTLILQKNPIVNINFVAYTNLKELDISYCSITNLKPLSTCDKFEIIRLYGYSELDLSPLHELPNFNSIYLSGDFDRSDIGFFADNFKQADKHTKVYIVANNRGLEINE